MHYFKFKELRIDVVKFLDGTKKKHSKVGVVIVVIVH